MTVAAAAGQIRSTIPTRLDRLRWTPFHTRMVVGLGAAWIPSRAGLATGHVVGGAIMVIVGVIGILFGTNADGRSLETIAEPLDHRCAGMIRMRRGALIESTLERHT